MQSSIEPLLQGLYKVGHCLVLLLDRQGQVVYKSLPRGYQDLHLLAPQALKAQMAHIRELAVPLMLSASQQVGGIAFRDGRTLVVGPLTKKLPFKIERKVPLEEQVSGSEVHLGADDSVGPVGIADAGKTASKSGSGGSSCDSSISSSESVASAASAGLAMAQVGLEASHAIGENSGSADAEVDLAQVREDELEKEEILQLRRNAVNVQLENIAWLAHRILGAEENSNDEEAIRELREGGLIENEVLRELAGVREILPDWREVVPEDRPHRSYVYEFSSLDAIRRGEPQQYMIAQTVRTNGQNGVLGYTSMRNKQNLSICGVVLNSRAAVAGGLAVEKAYTIADFLILAIERCKTEQQVEYVGTQSGKLFASLVQRLKRQYPRKTMHMLSVQLLEVVQRYLYTRVTRKQLAAELKVNPDYLDRVLKADCDSTALGCLRTARLDEAKKLLVQTSTPVYEIAELLLFSNSSHFSRLFKDQVGCTPQVYRKRYKDQITQIFM